MKRGRKRKKLIDPAINSAVILSSSVIAVPQIQDIEKCMSKSIVPLLSSLNKNFKRLENSIKNINELVFVNLKDTKDSLNNFTKQAEELEEGIMYVMHNIKKNQFLYSHYPEDWVNNYLDIKKGIKEENKFMDKKIEGINGN